MSGEYANWDPTELVTLLNYAETFADFPSGFVPPGLADLNYVPPNVGNRVTITALTTMALALVVVLARLWTRRFERSRAWGLDDWLIVAATVRGP
jgi:hypothetical protein